MTVYAVSQSMMSKLVGFDMQMTANPVGVNQSPMNRRTQTVEFPGDKWVIRMEWPELPWRDFQSHKAFWNRIRGPIHRVRVWCPINGGRPFGSLGGSPELGSDAGEGNNSVLISASPGSTLLPGDLFGVTLADATTQLCEAAQVSGTGMITVQLSAPLRKSAIAGSTITWNRPTVDCIVTAAMFPSYRSVVSEGYSVELIEE